MIRNDTENGSSGEFLMLQGSSLLDKIHHKQVPSSPCVRAPVHTYVGVTGQRCAALQRWRDRVH